MTALLEAFERQLLTGGERAAIICCRSGESISFTELDARARQRQALIPAEVRSPVGLCLGNGVAYVEAFLALRRHDVVVALMDAGSSVSERRQQGRALGLRWLCEAEAPAIGPSPGVSLGDDLSLVDLDLEPTRPPVTTAVIKLTSGSTGDPVGVCLSAEALEIGMRQIATGMELSERDRVLLSLPLSHSYGFDSGLVSLCVLGTPLVLVPPTLPAGLLRAIVEHQVTFLPLVPPVVYALGALEWPHCPSLRLVTSAGGRLLPEVARAFEAASGQTVHQFYGSTESGGISFEPRPSEAEASECVGFPLPGVEVNLDPEGLLAVRSGANFCGHFGPDQEARPRVVRTGDFAEWTATGRLRLLGRSAEMLNVGGRKVAASSIERSLAELAGVSQVAVVGVDDPARGERVVAFYSGSAESLDVRSLPQRLQPRVVKRLDELPVTSRGKIDRGALQRLARQMLGSSSWR